MNEDDLSRGCLLPIVQGGVCFLILFALGFGLARWQAWGDPGVIALIVGAAGALLTWSSGVLAWRRSAYGEPEFYYPPPAPRAEPDRVRVELTQPGDGPSRLTQLADLDVTPAQLRALAEGLLNGAPFAESAWTGAGRPFSRSQFAALRTEFLRRGWMDWRNPDAPAQGVILRAPGRAVLRTYASATTRPPTPPTPGGD